MVKKESGAKKHGFAGIFRNAVAVMTAAALALMLAGCSGGTSASSSSSNAAQAEVDYSDWDAVLEAAKGQTVTFYGYGGSQPRNQWIEDSLIPAMKEKYDINLELVGMDINDILTQLSGDKDAGVEEGTIDFIWINGENFYTAKENGYLWGPFTQYLPNFNDYVDAASPEVMYDFGSPVDGYEAPYGKTQMEMWVNSDIVPTPPTTVEEFKSFCEAHPGQVTYPEPGDFTGTAFISCLIAGVIGDDEFEKLSQMENPTEESVREIVEPGLEYLRSLNPSLWNAGSSFPSDSTTLGTMYADGEVIMNMGYGDPQALVDNGTLPASTKPFIFTSGTVGNSNFMAIAENAPHKAAALVAINEIMSPEMQLEQFETLGNLTVLDMSKLPEADQQKFDSVELGSAQLPAAELLSHRVTEAAGPVIPILEQLWHDEVVGN